MRKVTILGGERDGEIVPWVGRSMRLPIRRPLKFVPESDSIPSHSVGYDLDEFDARQDLDGRWWYVRRRP